MVFKIKELKYKSLALYICILFGFYINNQMQEIQGFY